MLDILVGHFLPSNIRESFLNVQSWPDWVFFFFSFEVLIFGFLFHLFTVFLIWLSLFDWIFLMFCHREDVICFIWFLTSVYGAMLMYCAPFKRIASLACMSALSLPYIPMCPDIHIRIMILFLCFASSSLFWVCIAISLGLNLFFTLMRDLNESLRIIYIWFWFGLWS